MSQTVLRLAPRPPQDGARSLSRPHGGTRQPRGEPRGTGWGLGEGPEGLVSSPFSVISPRGWPVGSPEGHSHPRRGPPASRRWGEADVGLGRALCVTCSKHTHYRCYLLEHRCVCVECEGKVLGAQVGPCSGTRRKLKARPGGPAGREVGAESARGEEAFGYR